MRLWTKTAPVMLTMVGLLIVGGLHTGCSSAGTADSLRRATSAPVVTAVTWTPAKAKLERFRPYVFQAVANDPDIGDSIVQYEWNFGDDTSVRTTTGPTASHIYVTSSETGFSLKVRAKDQRGTVGEWKTVPVPVDASESPLTVTTVDPLQAPIVATDIGGSLQVTYTVKIVDASKGVGSPGGPTIDLNGTLVDPGEANASVVARRDNLDGTYSFTLRYLGASAVGIRTVTPRIQALNSLGISSDLLGLPALTIQTKDPAGNRAPAIVITTPAGPRSVAYTSKPVEMEFTITDADGDPLNYTLNWGDGTPVVLGNLTGDTKMGKPIKLSHTYPDAFTATTREAQVVLTVTDNRQGGITAPQSRVFVVNFNALPTVVMTSPQASATAPAPAELPSNPAIGLQNPAGPNDPDITVIPVDGRLTFAAKGTLPASGDTPLTYAWTFSGGIPAASSLEAPGEVVFPLVTPGAIEAHLVTVTVTDTFGRSSLLANPNAKTYKKWVVVDGRNSQTFNLKFMYRQKTEDLIGASLLSTLSPALTAVNGLGAEVKIYQDGAVSTYQVQDPMGRAQVGIPVRANLPFYVSIPPFGTDAFTYMFRVPNAPIGPYADAGLGTREPASTDPRSKASAFWFQNPDATAAPWNPVLQIVTGQGFGPEVSTTEPRLRKVTGTFNGMLMGNWFPYSNKLKAGDTVITPDNNRWIDRLTMPTPSAFIYPSNSDIASFQSDSLQSFGDWLVGLMTLKAGTIPAEDLVDTGSAAAPTNEMGFILDHSKYQTATQASESFAVFGMQATRVPPHTADPYNVDVGGFGVLDGGWNNPTAVVAPDWTSTTVDGKTTWVIDPTKGLAPKSLGASYSEFYSRAIWGAPGASPLVSGIDTFYSPFEINYPGFPLKLVQPPYQPISQTQAGGYFMRTTSSYAEYLWSSAWARPLVLNRANLNAQTYYYGMTNFPWFRYSSTSRWPKLAAITGGSLERPTAIDLTPSGGTDFRPSMTPVGVANQPVPSGGIGRFYWTAAAPVHAYSFNTQPGLISRTWLSDAAQMPPTVFNGDASDAISVYGFFPPQTVVVDKRTRDTQGHVVSENSLGGYRITWYNPSQNMGSSVVAPDFWVVEVKQGGVQYHYLLPANYPGGAQKLGDPIVTDARTYLPSGNAWGNPNLPKGETPADPSNDQAAPGFCWFDVPKDLQPMALGMNPTNDINITVFAVKAILKNNPAPGARTLTRVEWMEAVKTVSATMKMSLGNGDFTYAHKLPFNYYWDIVVAQSATVTVKP